MAHEHDAPVWAPMARCTECGHRVSLSSGWRPIETRKLGWRAWLAEPFMRLLAKSQRNASGPKFSQEEREP